MIVVKNTHTERQVFVSESFKFEYAGDVVIIRLLLDSYDVFDDKVFMSAFYGIVKTKGPKVILDLRHTKYVSSVVLSTFITMRKTVCDAGGKLFLSSVSDRVKEVLHTTKLDKVFDIFDDEEKAMAGFNAKPQTGFWHKILGIKKCGRC